MNQERDCILYQPRNVGGSQRRLLIIIGISLVTMAGEIAGGMMSGSMALLADGWHMGTHVFALGVAYLAVHLTRRFAGDSRFAFGPAKVSALGGFAGAILLGIVAVEMLWEGGVRLWSPQQIHFDEAIFIAVIGLIVNGIGAWILHGGSDEAGHGHEHGHEHGGDHHHHGAGHHHDQNVRSAYLHVLTDALTSVLAIAALLMGRMFGWLWLDAAVAMLGGIIILKWGWGLLTASAAQLLDFVGDTEVQRQVMFALKGQSDNDIVDFHLWPSGNKYALLATVRAHDKNESREQIEGRLHHLDCLEHTTLELHWCGCH